MMFRRRKTAYTWGQRSEIGSLPRSPAGNSPVAGCTLSQGPSRNHVKGNQRYQAEQQDADLVERHA